MRHPKRLVALVAVAALVVVGAALAAWITTGSGSGKTAQALTIAEASPSQSLYSGATAASATITNRNLFPARVARLDLSSEVSVPNSVDTADATPTTGHVGWHVVTNDTISSA